MERDILFILIILCIILATLVLAGVYRLVKILKSQRQVNQTNEFKINKDTIEILKLEFEYARETAMQSQRDRFVIFNFYIILISTLIALSTGANELISLDITNFVSSIYLISTLVGFIFLIFIIRLRQAWFSSVLVMNKVKDYFIERDEDLIDYLKWNSNTLPRKERFMTISFLVAFSISFLSSVSLVIGLIYQSLPNLFIILVGIFYFLFSITLYYVLLKYGKERNQIRNLND